MPGWELIGKEENKSLRNLFNEGGVLFAHGFQSFRKRFHVREFEKKAKIKMKSKHALAVSNGTAAIKIGLKSLGVKQGDEVITQAFNFIATIEAILDIGAVPIIANVDNSLNMCPKDLAKLINKRTKVILPVHMLGVPADIAKILAVAKKNKIKVLEDNCEAMGAKYKKKYLCNFGDLGVVSYDFAKTITCGEGGMIFTNKKKIDKYCREYHDHGHENNRKYSRGMDTRKIFGFNFRITEMQGVVGKAQLKKLDKIIYENKKRYFALQKNMNNQIQLRKIPKYSEPIYDTFIFFVKNKNKLNKIVKYLNKIGIGTKNLPDAIKWHCAYYWNHALKKKQYMRSLKTKKILVKSIAIPIFIRRPLDFYSKIGRRISEILK